MGATLVIASNDVRRRLRDRTVLARAIVAPLALAAIMGLAFGHGGAGATVAIADLRPSATSQAATDDLIKTMAIGSTIRFVRTTDAAARAAYHAGQVSSVVEVQDGNVVGIVSSRNQPLGDAIARDFLATSALRRRAPAGPPAVTFSDAAINRPVNALGYFGPSMGIVFLFFAVGAAAESVLSERATGTLARLQASPVGLNRVIAGKALSIVAVMLLSMTTLWVATSVVFGAAWGDSVGVAALIVATVAAIAAIGLFVAVLARTEAGALAATTAVGLLLALFGGNFFPPGSLPPALEKLALITPNGWALDGFTTLSLDGGGVGAIVRPLVVLLVIAAVVGAVALSRLRRSVAF